MSGARRSRGAGEKWKRSDMAWRDPAKIVSLWNGAGQINPNMLKYNVSGTWWDVLEQTGATLLVTREYEHLAIALSCSRGRPRMTYIEVPHPSGIAVDRRTGRVWMASTRNPNQVIEFRLVREGIRGKGSSRSFSARATLVPAQTWFMPGATYLHELAMIGGRLYGNAVGMNAVVRLDPSGEPLPVWWPACIDGSRDKPRFENNYLQLNSIAAGKTLRSSFFTASAERIGARRPGHQNFPVDGRGVVFSGKTREPMCRGLTRPHSARCHRTRIWVDNSGYGEVGYVDGERFECVTALPCWTRGLCFHGSIAFVGASRVIPRFSNYAPGLDVRKTVCGIFAVHAKRGVVLGSITWPQGNQVFAVDWIPGSRGGHFPFEATHKNSVKRASDLFYSYDTQSRKERTQ